MCTGYTAECNANGHAYAGGVSLAQYIAGHHFSGHEQVGARLAVEMHGGGVVGCKAQVGERDTRFQRVGIKRGFDQRPGPMGLGRCQPLGVTVVQRGVVESADATGVVVVLDGLDELILRQFQLAGQVLQGIGRGSGRRAA